MASVKNESYIQRMLEGLFQLLKANKLNDKARFLRIFSQVSPSSDNWEDCVSGQLVVCLCFHIEKAFLWYVWSEPLV